MVSIMFKPTVSSIIKCATKVIRINKNRFIQKKLFTIINYDEEINVAGGYIYEMKLITQRIIIPILAIADISS